MRKKPKRYCVYLHINLINGKIYVGQTCQKPQKRWGKNGEGYKHNKKFWNDIKKYGWENFAHRIVCANLTSKQADFIEEEYIKLYKSIEHGYNNINGRKIRWK